MTKYYSILHTCVYTLNYWLNTRQPILFFYLLLYHVSQSLVGEDIHIDENSYFIILGSWSSLSSPQICNVMKRVTSLREEIAMNLPCSCDANCKDTRFFQLDWKIMYTNPLITFASWDPHQKKECVSKLSN